MKKKIIILPILLIWLNAFSQIDSTIHSWIKCNTDSLTNTLEKIYQSDVTKSGTFNIDTVVINNGELKIFSVSLTAILNNTNGRMISSFSVRNTNGIYSVIDNIPTNVFHGIAGVTITVTTLNNGTICVVKIAGGNPLIIYHYRRTEA
jgi:hypothetical protein